jgi:cupin 2 domain-containing protein
VPNLFEDILPRADEEIVTELLSREGVRIERIVSTGQSTPNDKPYNQAHDEWVLLLAGSAGLWIEGEGDHTLRPGDHVLIQAHRPHRVTWTTKDEPTVWLAIHLGRSWMPRLRQQRMAPRPGRRHCDRTGQFERVLDAPRARDVFAPRRGLLPLLDSPDVEILVPRLSIAATRCVLDTAHAFLERIFR